MTIENIVSLYRTTIRQRQQTCALTNEELYYLMNNLANQIKKDVLDKGKNLHQKNYRSITVDMEKFIFKNECYPDWMGCKVLRSVDSIPTILANQIKGYEALVTDNSHNQITHMLFTHGKRLAGHKMLKAYYDIIDGYLYIFKEMEPMCVKVFACWEDVTNLADLIGSNNLPCFDIQRDEFPIDDAYIPIIFMALDKQLSDVYLRKTEDQTSDERD